MNTSLRRHIMERLDRRGTRWLLSMLTTRRGRRLTGKDVAVFYDNIWMHRVGDRYLTDSPRFRYHDWDILHWESGFESVQREAADYWFYRYQPGLGDVIVDVGA